jgi:hypothetical protein
MRNKYGALLLIATLHMAPGCTTRAWYTTVQASAKQACLREPASEQERCEARLNKSDFDAYEKHRSRK